MCWAQCRPYDAVQSWATRAPCALKFDCLLVFHVQLQKGPRGLVLWQPLGDDKGAHHRPAKATRSADSTGHCTQGRPPCLGGAMDNCRNGGSSCCAHTHEAQAASVSSKHCLAPISGKPQSTCALSLLGPRPAHLGRRRIVSSARINTLLCNCSGSIWGQLSLTWS